ncbi:MAG: hypothetical protein E7460_01690 [Ruminococcaceae bacterium]|nr:hypothetical protein [Oscillospiraceae bacterium]
MRGDTIIIDTSREFRLLQLSDLRLATWHGGSLAEKTLEFVRNAVLAARPDFIAVTGDLVCGYFPCEMLRSFCAVMDELDVPWGFCFGDRDRSSVADPKSLENILEGSSSCLYRTGDESVFGYGNYSVRFTDENGKTVHVLCFIDNSCLHKYDGLSGYTCSSLSQNQWFRESQLKLFRECDGFITWVFVHTPLPEFENRSVPVNSGLFCTLAEDPTVKYLFCGGDLGTPGVIEKLGIKLICGPSSGYGSASGGAETKNAGARLCTVLADGEFSTCIFMDDGTWRNDDGQPVPAPGECHE